MSSRLKERGGAGGKIIASKPSKTLSLPSRQDKPCSQTIPLAAAQKEISRPISACRPSISRLDHLGKENPRPLSAGRPSVARSSAGKDNTRPLSACRASVARSHTSPLKQAERPAAALLRSTSSFPRGKITNILSHDIPRVSSSKERRSFSGLRALNKEIVGRGQQINIYSTKGKKSVIKGKGVSDSCGSNVYLGSKTETNACKVLTKAGDKAETLNASPSDSKICMGKGFSCPDLNPADKIRTTSVRTSETTADGVVAKHIKGIGHRNETVGSHIDEVSRSKEFATIEVEAFKEGRFCIDNTAVLVEKSCLNLHSKANTSNDFGANSHIECRNTSLINVHHKRGAVPLRLESLKAEGNGAAETMKDACSANRNQSKLHEKLALLEVKVQKIAMEIKETKDMLDKNKSGKPRLAVSDIQKKISGVEKAINNIKDGTKFELLSSQPGEFGYLQDSCVDSNVTEKTGSSLPSIKGLNHKELEARFFPHQKLTRDCLSSAILVDHDKLCEPACFGLNGDRNVVDGLIDQNPIALEFLASLREEQPKPKVFEVNMQLTCGVVDKMQPANTSSATYDSGSVSRGQQQEVAFETSEKLEEFDTSENNPSSMACLSTEEISTCQLSEIGRKVSTGGWFVSEGEAVLLAHDDNSCSYYDIANSEVKSEYKAPSGFPGNLWGDCWFIRAPGIDGCSGRYVVAASAGNALESGFCSWDFYTKDVKAFQVVGGKENALSGSSSRSAIASMAGSSQQSSSSLESQSCWYRPCGPLLIYTSSRQKAVKAYDIRDGDLVMAWEVNSAVAEMEYSSPLQWRSKGKVIIAEKEAITIWDVNSLNPQPILSVPFVGKRICSLHVNNTDAEIGAGVRQRASSNEVEGNDGVFCTQDSVNVLDFRAPSGVGLKIPRQGADALSIFSRGDSILLGSTEARLPTKSSPRSHVEHFSIRKGSLAATYRLPEFNSHYYHSSISQVWGNSNIVMGICGMGLFVYDAFNNGGLRSAGIWKGCIDAVKETVGPDDLFRPTFDYMESRVLIISRDRPAVWKYLL